MITINNFSDILKINIKRKFLDNIGIRDTNYSTYTKGSDYTNDDLYQAVHKDAVDNYFNNYAGSEESLFEDVTIETKYFSFDQNGTSNTINESIGERHFHILRNIGEWSEYESGKASASENLTVFYSKYEKSLIRFDYSVSKIDLILSEFLRFTDLNDRTIGRNASYATRLFKNPNGDIIYSKVNYKEDNNNYAQYLGVSGNITLERINKHNMLHNDIIILETVQTNYYYAFRPLKIHRLIKSDGTPLKYRDIFSLNTVIEDNADADYVIRVDAQSFDLEIFQRNFLEFENIETDDYKLEIFHHNTLKDNGINQFSLSTYDEHEGKVTIEFYDSDNAFKRINYSGKTYNYFIRGPFKNILLDDLNEQANENNSHIIRMLYPNIKSDYSTPSFKFYKDSNSSISNGSTYDSFLNYFKINQFQNFHNAYSHSIYYKTVSDFYTLTYDHLRNGIVDLLPKTDYGEYEDLKFEVRTQTISEADIDNLIARENITDETSISNIKRRQIPGWILENRKTDNFISYIPHNFYVGYKETKNDIFTSNSITYNRELLFESKQDQFINVQLFNLANRTFYITWKNPLKLRENQKITISVSLNETLY